MDFFEKLIYDLVSLVAKMMDLVVGVCNTLCGIPDSAGNSQLYNLIQPTSTSGKVLIGIFSGLCIVTGLIATVIAMVESFNVKAADGFSPQKPYIDVLKGIMHMTVVAALFYTVVLLVGAVGTLIEDGMRTISGSLGISSSDTLGGRLLQNCFDSSSLQDKEIDDWSAAWASGAIPQWRDIKGIGDISKTFNSWQAIITVFVVAAPLFGILTYMAKRLINIMLLFTVAPIAFSMYPLDDGHAKSEWYKDMKGAVLGGVVMMIMLNLFLLISGIMFDAEHPLIKGDPVMNGIAQTFILGAGISMLISITKIVLKYLGCDDTLLANMKSMSPVRSLKAIGSGIKTVGAKAKSKIQSRRGASPESDTDGGGNERERLQRTTNRISASRKASLSRSRMVSSSGGATGSDVNKPSGASKKIARAVSNGDYARAPKIAPKLIEKSTAIPRARMTAKSGQIDNAKLKNAHRVDKASVKADSKKNKDVESISKALDKFTKAILKLTKPAIKIDGKAKQPAKIERKREVAKVVAKASAIAIKPTQGGSNTGKPTGTVKVTNKPAINVTNTIKATTNMRPTINGASNKAGDYGLKQSIKRNEQMLRQNMDKLKKMNSNILAMPRKVTKSITIKKNK